MSFPPAFYYFSRVGFLKLFVLAEPLESLEKIVELRIIPHSYVNFSQPKH